MSAGGRQSAPTARVAGVPQTGRAAPAKRAARRSATRARTAARASAKAATARTARSELERRLARFPVRAASDLRWNASQRARWEAKARGALAGNPERALAAARQLSRFASRLSSTARAREALRLAALLRIHGEVARASSPEVALRALLGALREALEFEQATAFLYDAEGGRLIPKVVEGSHVDLIPDIAFDHGAGFSSWVAKTRRPVLLSTYREDPEAPGTGRPASFLSVPLVAEDEMMGVMNLAHRQPGAFTAGDRDLVILAGGLAADAIRRRRGDLAGAPVSGATTVAGAPVSGATPLAGSLLSGARSLAHPATSSARPLARPARVEPRVS